MDKAGLDKFRGTGRSRLEIDWLLFAQDDFVTDSRPPDAAPKSREWPARARKRGFGRRKNVHPVSGVSHRHRIIIFKGVLGA